MSSVDDEIALLADDIRRWAGADARIHQALEQLLKIYGAEVEALAFEAVALQRETVFGVPRDPESDAQLRADTAAVTERENARIRTAHHDQTVRWIHRDY
jgi:hypothetical protein